MITNLTIGPLASQSYQPWRADGRFMICLPITLAEEGGNSNTKHDRGGRTSRGIIQREYDRYRTQHGAVLRSVFEMTDDEMHDIYFHEYWRPHCDDLPRGLDLSAFDNMVNEGPHEAIVLLQKCLGVRDDGACGPITLSRLKVATATPYQERGLISHYAQARERFYRSLSDFQYFGADWIERAQRIRDASLQMVPKV